MEWIKVKPGFELPHEGERVLVFAAQTWEEAEFVEGSFCLIDGPAFEGVTHWLRVTPPD